LKIQKSSNGRPALLPCAAWLLRADSTRHLAPTRRQDDVEDPSTLPFSPAQISLAPYAARTRQSASAAMADGASSMPPVLCSPFVPTECGIAFSSLCRTSCTPLPVVPPPEHQSPPSPSLCGSLCTWPGGHEPSPAELGPPWSSRGPPGAPPPLRLHRRAPRRPEPRAPTTSDASSALIRVKDFMQQFEEMQGPNCNVIDSYE
jgi:hypothetical protein